MIVTKPNKVENMKEIHPNVWTSVNFPKNHVAVLHYSLSPKYGQTLIKRVVRASNVPVSGKWNDKIERNWRSKYPNFYCGTQTNGQMIFYTEKLTPTKSTRFYFSWPGHNPAGQLEVWTYKFPSGLGKADGKITVQIGPKSFSFNKWQCDSAEYPGLPTDWCFQEVISGSPSLSASAFVTFTSPTVELV